MGTTNTITGTVYKIGQTNHVSDKFSKREIAIQWFICDTFNISMEELHAGERDIK